MRAIVAVADLLTRERLESAGRAAGYEIVATRSLPQPAEADLLVVDLDEPGALDAVERWREAGARVVGFAFHVNEETIKQAKVLGANVLPHGATAQAAQFFA